MHDLFAALAQRSGHAGDKTAFDDGQTRLGYAALARRVAGAAEEIRAIAPTPGVIGLLGGNCTEWVIGQLAGWHAGKIVVPLPAFFRVPQLRHVVQDAGIGCVLTTRDMTGTARLLGVPIAPIAEREAILVEGAAGGAGQIIYTSGSTGQPKGVLLQNGQLLWTAQALIRAIDARDGDSYLSVLPLVLLLETICAVVIPIFAGASVRLASAVSAGFDAASGQTLAALAADHRPSCMTLVPQLLALWVDELSRAGRRAPEMLRFVAVGGAMVPPSLARQAWDLGIPVHEGYGLSECGSVVALNRPGERKPGSVGRPLPGLKVGIENGEIVVRGAPVMDRYVHGASAGGQWRTGDVGDMDAEGYLTVRGRVDNLIVTPLGRNISPEWLEALLTADSRIADCIVTDVAGPLLTAIIVPTTQGQEWFEQASEKDIRALAKTCCSDAPAYAVPQNFIVARADELHRFGLLTGNGRLRRRATIEVFVSLHRSRQSEFLVTQRQESTR